MSCAQNTRASFDAEEVNNLFALINGSKRRRFLVYPIEAGREMLQEAPVRTLHIISEAIRVAQTNLIGAKQIHGAGKEMECKQPQDDVASIFGYFVQTRELSGVSAVTLDFPEIDTLNEQLKLPTDHKSKDIEKVKIDVVNDASTVPRVRNQDEAKKKGRRAREFDVRKERAAERKAKNERLKRQQELDRLKRTKRLEADALKQQEERFAMQDEDGRSKDVERHMR